MAAKNLISNSQHKISHQKWKKPLSRKIRLITGDCKYNYIAEIKIAKSYSVTLYGVNKF